MMISKFKKSKQDNSGNGKQIYLELLGLPGAGKSSSLKNYSEFRPVNEFLKTNFLVRQVRKVEMALVVLLTRPKTAYAIFAFGLRHAKMKKYALTVNLLNQFYLLEHGRNIKKISDQGYFQAIWSIAATGTIKDDFLKDLDSIERLFSLPDEVVIFEDSIENIVRRQTRRDGRAGWYYRTEDAIMHSEDAWNFILDWVKRNYELAG